MQEYINGKVLINKKLVKKNFAIDQGILFFHYDKTKIKQTFDLKNKVVSPGFVDIHCHTRNPGFTYKESLESFYESCLSGGFTTILAMANVKPLPTNVWKFKRVFKIFKNAPIKVFQCARVTKNQKKVVNFQKLKKHTTFFSDDGNSIGNSNLMKKVLNRAKKAKVNLLLHEQNIHLTGYAYTSAFSLKNNIESFGPEYEAFKIKEDLTINQNIKAKLHFQHVSTKKGLEHIMSFSKKQKQNTFELTPHHLYFNNTLIKKNDGIFKVNPPIGSRVDQDFLVNYFKNNENVIIATDHAPHTNQEKQGGFAKAAFGIINLQTAFASINTLMGTKNLVKTLLALTYNPSQFLNIDIEIKNNQRANIVIIDPAQKWVFTKKDLKSQSQNSPFLNEKFEGKVVKVIYGQMERNL